MINQKLKENPYSLKEINKNKYFRKKIISLTSHHKKNCREYNKIVNFLGYKIKKEHTIEKLPYLPVQIFKEVDLLSINKKQIVKVINSSGTTDGKRAKIYLDKKNSLNQIQALKKIIQFHIGNHRLPMLVIDKKSSIFNSRGFDAKKAAFFGFSIFGKNIFFLLKENGKIDYQGLEKFFKKFNSKFIIFGFTYQVYENLYNKLKINKINRKIKRAIVIHGGGWKKMEKKKISNNQFKINLKKKLKINNFLNYYGLAEQTGSIFLECKCGYFVTTDYSDIIIRNEELNVCNDMEKGFIQLLSILPTSYPGHNILTQDIGQIVNKKNCKCKINGKRFVVHGRAKKAELRGCSDVSN